MESYERPLSHEQIRKFILDHPYLTDGQIAKRVKQFNSLGIRNFRQSIENEKKITHVSIPFNQNHINIILNKKSIEIPAKIEIYADVTYSNFGKFEVTIKQVL